jgi:GAF domain-containing protein
VVADTVTAPELDDPSLGGRDTLVALRTRAVIATPILVFDRIIGVFGLHRAEPSAWSVHEISLAEAVAREIGLAVHTRGCCSRTSGACRSRPPSSRPARCSPPTSGSPP